jgi:hypothetical protein
MYYGYVYYRSPWIHVLYINMDTCIIDHHGYVYYRSHGSSKYAILVFWSAQELEQFLEKFVSDKILLAVLFN